MSSALRSAFRHWLPTLNAALGVFLVGGLAAPVLAAAGWRSVADGLYAVYHLTCHQWAFRSFFLFAPGAAAGPPLASYSQQQLSETAAADPYTFVGAPQLGWKMAFCERDLAIYVGLLAVGLVYARRRELRPASFGAYGVLIAPMALDGFTQLFGWRESTWELRVSTGLLFGLASGWLVLPRLDQAFSTGPRPKSRPPRLDDAFGLRPQPAQYAAGRQCTPAQGPTPPRADQTTPAPPPPPVPTPVPTPALGPEALPRG